MNPSVDQNDGLKQKHTKSNTLNPWPIVSIYEKLDTVFILKLERPWRML